MNPGEERLIHPSEIREFVYCRRSWHLARRGALSALAAERQAGITGHQAHSLKVRAGGRAVAIKPWLSVALLLALVWLLWLLS